MAWRVEERNGIYLPDVDWRLDARTPSRRCFVSHAHFDHMGDHETILCSRATAALMQERLPGSREWRVYDFDEPFELEPGVRGLLRPAGHIIGSAMLWLEKDGRSILYTGDFKLSPSLCAERCQPLKANTLILETTFGTPRYTFPPEDEVIADIVRFCQETIENGDTPVLFGYSLGKSQAILRALADSRLVIELHPQSYKLTEACLALGWTFPDYRLVDENAPPERARVVVSPPLQRNATWLKRIRNAKTAMISGWAIDPSSVYRYQCDKAFPLSDHADYLDLQAFVAQVQPTMVYTVHGFAQEFAATLREQGYQSWALGRQNQLDFAEILEAGRGVPLPPILPVAEPEGRALDLTSFAALAELAESIGKTDSKRLKVELLAQRLSEQATPDAALSALFLTGRPFPSASEKRLQIGWAAARQALLHAVGSSEAEFKRLYQQYRDGSEVAAALLARRPVAPSRSLQSMRALFDNLAAAPSPAFRQSLLSEEFRKLTPTEGKLLLKIISGDLRIGLKEGLVEEAVAIALGAEFAAARKANLRCGDIEAVVHAAAKGQLESIALRPFHPLQFMLASPEPSGESVVVRLGETVWTEDKYDGIRCQIHKQGERVELYSRELNRITHQFPEIVEAARMVPQNFVADGEVVAWGYERPLPFAELQKRLGRRGEDLFLGEEIPVLLWLYDLLWLEGVDMLDLPLEARRSKLDTFSVNDRVRIAPARLLRGAAAIEEAFAAARARGNEGLMFKDPKSAYHPGRRGLSWLKLKKAFATIDAVVVAAEYGHGKRKGMLSDYTFAVIDETSGDLKTIGKAYTGLTNAEIEALTERFLAITLIDEGSLKRVRPEVVLEIAFDSIRPSKRHDSGLALRFPRIKRIREDKSPEQIDTVQRCAKLCIAPEAT